MTDQTGPPVADVLVVEDAATNLRLLSHMLRKAGYRVRVARDSKSALRSATAHTPDLVLMDVNLPDLDGFETIARIRAAGALGDAPVIFISGRANAIDKVHAFRTGGADYVTKPFNTAEVLARVAHQLEMQELQRTLRRQRDELRESEAVREALLEMVVHDMRSPLMSVSAAIDLELLDADPEDASPALASARRSVSYLVELATALLDVGRVETSGLDLDLGEHDLCAIAAEALDPLRGTDQAARVKLAGPPTGCRAVCDRLITRRVFANLLEGALRASSEPVEVTIRAVDDTVEVRFLDRGPPIPEDQRRVIFERFARRPAGSGSRRLGMGIGLVFCRIAVVAQQGRIGVDDHPPEGAAFWFALPAAPDGDREPTRVPVPTVEREC